MKNTDVLIDGDVMRWLDRALRYLEHEIDFVADDEAIEFNDGKVTLEIIQNAFKSVTNIEPELVDQMELK
jgi:hypothetical protein